MKRIPKIVLACLISGALAVPAVAHHSAAAFDSQKTVQVKGTVKVYSFKNPHVYMTVEVKNADGSTNADVLEMIESDERCPALNVCSTVAAGSASTFLTREGRPQCLTDAVGVGMAFITDNLNMTVQPITSLPVAALCPGVATGYNGTIGLAVAVAVGTNPAVPAAPAVAAPMFLHTGRVVRYMIANNLDPLDPSPTLWRSVTGRYTPGATTVSSAPGTAGSAWQPVARGIEDMQVEYMTAVGTWANSPPLAVPCPAPAGPCTAVASYDALVRQVRVTLSARAVGQPNAPIQGATTAGAGIAVAPNAIRGQLISVTQPRAAAVALHLGDQIR
jgi:hypothetical protein